jgi:hypothetical protein
MRGASGSCLKISPHIQSDSETINESDSFGLEILHLHTKHSRTVKVSIMSDANPGDKQQLPRYTCGIPSNEFAVRSISQFGEPPYACT